MEVGSQDQIAQLNRLLEKEEGHEKHDGLEKVWFVFGDPGRTWDVSRLWAIAERYILRTGLRGFLLSRVMASGKVVAAFNLANAPWEDKDPASGNFTGMSVDLMQGFAKGIGVQVEFMPLEFGSLIPAIQAGKADIICTNLSRTMARSTKVL